ncbi:hypothetical protein COLU111180_00280 [Cohnella lubricantis]|uniref:ParA family protein n=1 Tax=Cohnella lubricantis TaxID=2163172 RepID=A0A841T6D6_9BACL|nr:hypothetical protein [Cohnella lubricantis]MBB6677103.1 hypothetical protein [Cohnella lubricantis]MBP2118950.1 MinD-like ATPase involved in chromosome partitioning or flagellar assembly [Cohnella lubricantis]
MVKRIVLAVPEPQYAAKLARYLKETRADWEVAAFTQELALQRHLREARDAAALLVHSSLLPQARGCAEEAGLLSKLIVLTERAGDGDGLPELAQFQPLSSLTAELAERIGPARGGGWTASAGTQIWTVFSASGGAGKTTAALNIVKQAGERGCRAFYLNLEPLNATDLLFGSGEPDSLSRLLYSLQSRPEQSDQEWERLRRRQQVLQADYLDAPELPSERLAMTAERLKSLLNLIAASGAYDLIVVDPDSGCEEWHRELLLASNRVVWLAPDDALALRKADKLVRYWQDRLPADSGQVAFVLNKTGGGNGCRWTLPGTEPAARLPYIPQWKTLDQPGRLLQAPAYSGAVDLLLDLFGLAMEPASAERRGGSHGRSRLVAQRTG